MSALAAAGQPCLAVNLPGHAGTGPTDTTWTGSSNGCTSAQQQQQQDHQQYASCYSIEAAAAAVEAAAAAVFGAGSRCLLVGYSMGARVALQMVLAGSSSSSSSRVCWAGAVVVSGTPGMPDADLRSARISKDAELAAMLTEAGAAAFLEWWYQQPLWASFRAHPGFSRIVARRAAELAGQEQQLAAALLYMSTGRMVSLKQQQQQQQC